ncbi:sigma-70 family RNA polymerase sigma factor [Actinomycetospora sp. NBRC 106378]|uniref:sigma-70 family RNA polymerase sigma factor n=1 Tax=Actinomycetospora sp. NBRC 106378 TaxID=3032208 RepID=UPI0024A25349|nr:sigma-70 family RNA polymerase sigma factor [Actinomycetospora sp. NBRC 106378]GLZ55092.1 RNA polymerase sigma factor [Actinomycetospora sp. NBRC 106378]
MEPTELAERFAAHRPHLLAVAGRLVGPDAAEDAVQETWLRLARQDDPDAIDNLAGWLTTVVARIALNQLRARRPTDDTPEDLPDDAVDAESLAVSADTVGPALTLVLDRLSPAERLAFVLHDVFGLPFEEIAPIVDRTVAATRQLASRGRRRVRGLAPDATIEHADREASRASAEVVSAFLSAARDGDFGALLQLLDPEVVLRADPVAVRMATINAGRGAPQLAPEVPGADAVARVFAGRAHAAVPVLIDGVPGLVYATAKRVVSMFRFTVVDGRVTAVEVVADQEVIRATEVEFT